MSIKELRLAKKLTQKQAADLIGISLRSYITYENDGTKSDSIKYRFIQQELERINRLDEEHGLLELDEISSVCSDVFKDYDVNYCYLFGSYAKGTAGEKSDVDLLISSSVTGLRFYGLAERLRESLKKKVDLLNSEQLVNNRELIEEILKEGIKVYG